MARTKRQRLNVEDSHRKKVFDILDTLDSSLTIARLSALASCSNYLVKSWMRRRGIDYTTKLPGRSRR